jgi:hypothetical protein
MLGCISALVLLTAGTAIGVGIARVLIAWCDDAPQPETACKNVWCSVCNDDGRPCNRCR